MRCGLMSNTKNKCVIRPKIRNGNGFIVLKNKVKLIKLSFNFK